MISYDKFLEKECLSKTKTVVKQSKSGSGPEECVAPRKTQNPKTDDLKGGKVFYSKMHQLARKICSFSAHCLMNFSALLAMKRSIGTVLAFR